MDYVVGNRPFVNQSRFLLDSNAWIVGDPIYDPSTFFDLIRAVPGIPDPNNDNVCFFEFEGEVNDDRFFGDNEPFQTLDGSGNVIRDDFTVFRKRKTSVPIFDDEGFVVGFTWYHQIYPAQEIISSSHQRIQPGIQVNSEGANPAHMLNQLIFEEWPHGLGNSYENFNFESLEALGVTCEEEGLQSTVLFKAEEDFEAIIENILADISAKIYLDPETGLYTFKAIRKASASETIIEVPQAAIVSDEPELETFHGERPTDKLVYVFPDRLAAFRDQTVTIPDDTQARAGRRQKITKVPLLLARNWGVARRMADFRSQEEFASTTAVKVKLNHEAIVLCLGVSFRFENNDCSYRSISYQASPDSSEVTVEAIRDFFNVQKGEIDDTPQEDYEPPRGRLEPDYAFFIHEFGRYLYKSRDSYVEILRHRANTEVGTSVVHFSEDDISYNPVWNSNALAAGGTLVADMPEGLGTLDSDGFLFVPLGADALNVEDLTGRDSDYYSGFNVCIVEREVMFIRLVEAEGENRARAIDVMRARQDTRADFHPKGAPVFILPFASFSARTNPFWRNGATGWFKSQPADGGESVPLTDISPYRIDFDAPSGRPIKPGAFAMTTDFLNPYKFNRHAYKTGDSFVFTWDYGLHEGGPFLARTGAGFQGLGEPTSVTPFVGTFTLRIRDSLGNLKREFEAINGTFKPYSNAELRADFLNVEPAEFIVDVVQVEGIYESDVAQIRIELISGEGGEDSALWDGDEMIITPAGEHILISDPVFPTGELFRDIAQGIS